jgi:endonuclease/exonuclease/phosphatase family metal-dependent hydrolase
MVGPGVEVAGYRVLSSPATALASDHLPVVADLVLPG